MLLLGSIPTAFTGLLLSGYVEMLFQSTLAVGCMLLITGIILRWLTVLPAGKKDLSGMGPCDALFVGLAQGIAVIPGISRSGSTIAGAVFKGLEPESAVRYSLCFPPRPSPGPHFGSPATLWRAR